MGFQVKLVKASVMEKCPVMKNNSEFLFFFFFEKILLNAQINLYVILFFRHPQLQQRLILDEEHHDCGKLARTREKHPAAVSTAKEGTESMFVAHNAVAGLSLKTNSYHLLIYSLPFKMKYL